jgi:hypothetical protein
MTSFERRPPDIFTRNEPDTVEQLLLLPDEQTAMKQLEGLHRQIEETMRSLARRVVETATTVRKSERNVARLQESIAEATQKEDERSESLQEFFADAIDVAARSTDLAAAAKLVASLEEVDCADADELRARFIRGVAGRKDASYKGLRAVARYLNIDDEELAEDAPELMTAITRAGVREGQVGILSKIWIEDVDWSTFARAELRGFLDSAMEELLPAAVVAEDLPWETVNVGIDELAPLALPDPLDRVEWLFDFFKSTMGTSSNSDLSEMLTERVIAWLFSDPPKGSSETDEERLRRAKALAGRVESWEGWLESDSLDSARSELRQKLGEDDEDGDEDEDEDEDE